MFQRVLNIILRICLVVLLTLEIRCSNFRSSHPDVFLVKGVLKICSKFTSEHPCRSAISIKLQSNLNFPVWTFSIMSRCYYKCNKRNLSLIKAMLCRIRNYFLFLEHTSSCFNVLTFVCNWRWKLFTTIPTWTQTFCGCLPTSINKIWVFYDVLHALYPNKCL